METQLPAGKAQKNQKPFYKKWWFITIAVIVVLSAIFGSSEDKKDNDKPAQEQATKSEDVVANPEGKKDDTKEEVKREVIADEVAVKLPKYEIVYEVKDKRYDGGVNYYVLIEPINLADDSFKNDIKALVNQIVKEKGSKISIEFFDKKEALEFHYDKWVKMAISRPQTQQENDLLALHYIAGFSGELQTDPDFNSLSFFLATFKDNPKVGKYVENMKFNPNK